jgi:hypothetical protein
MSDQLGTLAGLKDFTYIGLGWDSLNLHTILYSLPSWSGSGQVWFGLVGLSDFFFF